jgi:hypothetical protein
MGNNPAEKPQNLAITAAINGGGGDSSFCHQFVLVE